MIQMDPVAEAPVVWERELTRRDHLVRVGVAAWPVVMALYVPLHQVLGGQGAAGVGLVSMALTVVCAAMMVVRARDREGSTTSGDLLVATTGSGFPLAAARAIYLGLPCACDPASSTTTVVVPAGSSTDEVLGAVAVLDGLEAGGDVDNLLRLRRQVRAKAPVIPAVVDGGRARACLDGVDGPLSGEEMVDDAGMGWATAAAVAATLAANAATLAAV